MPINNPFVNDSLDDTVNLPRGDVPGLHRAVLEQCIEALELTCREGRSTSLLIVGEAGSGKSHLIAQLRMQFAANPKAVLGAISLGGAYAGRLWRHLRERLMNELLRSFPNTENGENGLLRILRNRFPKWISPQGPASGMLSILMGRSSSGDVLRQQMNDFQMDRSVRQVLLHYLSSAELSNLAKDWMLGQDLTGEDLARLGLPPQILSEMEQESLARKVVLSLLQLGGDKTTLFLCFDEVEGIQASNYDALILREFATLATSLLAETGSRVIATFIRPNLQIALTKAIERGNLQKLSQFTATIPALAWEQAVQIVRSRLDAEPTCNADRQRHPNQPDWPLSSEFLEKIFQDNRRDLTPRHLIRACRVEFRRHQTGKSIKDLPPDSHKPDLDLATNLAGIWEQYRNNFLKRFPSIQFDQVMALGLPWLLELIEATLIRLEDKDYRLGDVNLVFHCSGNGRNSIGISFCNQEPRLLWHRLDRLLKQWNETKGSVLSQLIIIRCESVPTTPNAKSRLEKLRNAGTRVILIQKQQLAELAAFQLMLTKTLNGDLTRHGKPVATLDYNSWVVANLSEAVKELLFQIFEMETPKSAKRQHGAKMKSAKVN